LTEKRPARKAKKIWLLGDVITIKATGKETGGKYLVWEINAPSLSGPPPHYDTNLEEAFYVLEGEFSFQYYEMVINATSGSFTNIQKGVVHTYKNTAKSIDRLLVTVIPAGIRGTCNR